MRRLTVVAWVGMGLAMGAGCRERQDARTAADPTEGSTAAERAVANPLLGAVSGTVAGASEGQLQLREAGGESVVLTTDDQTQVVRDGRPVGLDSLQPGTEVRAAYVVDGEEWRARRVDVVPPASR